MMHADGNLTLLLVLSLVLLDTAISEILHPALQQSRGGWGSTGGSCDHKLAGDCSRLGQAVRRMLAGCVYSHPPLQQLSVL